MMRRILLQIAITIIAILSAVEEAAWTVPFRLQDFPGREAASDQAHLFGWLAVAVTGMAFAWSTPGGWLKRSVVCVLCALCYSCAFDIAYALAIGQPWNYLGTTAWWDVALRGVGSIKPFILLALIGAGNYLYRKI